MPGAPTEDSEIRQEAAALSDDSSEEGEVPQIRKRGPVEDEGEGKSSVMPETMAAAARASAQVTEISEDLGEAVGVVGAHEIHSRISAASSASSVNEHKRVVSKSGAVGKQVGAATGASLSQIIHAAARRVGAHQCDGCGRKDLYDYFTCQDDGCMNEQQRLGLEGGYDLCASCYTKLQTANGKATFHPSSHTFRSHNNAQYTLQFLGGIVLIMILLRFILSRLFGAAEA